MFRRTPITWAIYGSIGAAASFVYLVGPIAPILVNDLGLTPSAAGIVGTALAAGSATASLTGPALVRRIGRDGAMKASLIAQAAFLIGIAAVPRMLSGTGAFAAVLILVWLAASCGATLVNAATARLSAAHPGQSGQAITEGNAAAGWVGLFSPLLLGAALGTGLGWWTGPAFCLIAVACAVTGLAVADRHTEEVNRNDTAPGGAAVAAPDATREVASGAIGGAAPQRREAGLPRIFWIAMVALFAAVGIEFALTFWGSTLIALRTGADRATATACVSALVAGIAVGRTGGSRVTTRYGAHQTILGGFALAAAGFSVVWSSTSLPISVLGMIVTGLGIAPLFPLVIDRAILLSGGHPDRAMSRASLVLGSAVAGAPFALGALGSVMPVTAAMMLVPLLIGIGLLGTATSHRR